MPSHSTIFSAFSLFLAVGLLAFSGCGKRLGETKEKVSDVATGNSAHFAATAAQIDLGGELLAYMDIEGDLSGFANFLNSLLERVKTEFPESRGVEVDFNDVLTNLGLTSVRSLGFSSVNEGAGTYLNRFHAVVTAENRGILNFYGSAPAPFRILELAPANADIVSEYELDFAAVFAAVEKAASQIPGVSLGWNQVVYQELPELQRNAASILRDLRLRAYGWADLPADFFDVERGLQGVEPPPMGPMDFMFALDGLGSSGIDFPSLLGDFVVAVEGDYGDWTVYRVKPEVLETGDFASGVAETIFLAFDPAGDARVASEVAFITDQPNNLLANAEAFKMATNGLPTEGNALEYVSEAYFEDSKRLLQSALLMGLQEGLPAAQAELIDSILSDEIFERIDTTATASVILVDDQGISAVGRSFISPKAATLAVPAGFVGMAGAIAIGYENLRPPESE
jgi:hypothetical protein